jgi:hypothetical protein
MRKIYETQIINGWQFKVYGKNAYGEYVIRAYVNGKLTNQDSFENDKESAIGTAKAQYEWARGKQ